MFAPLAGVTVVELAAVLAGPTCGQFLAELGATVIKIEPPNGDVTRTWRQPQEQSRGNRSDYFCACNWGKETHVLDLKHPSGQDALHALTREADVVLSSYRPGSDRALGADADTLLRLNPRLIVVSVTGYGPENTRPGYDAVIQAEVGFMAMNGFPDSPPLKMPVALMDLLAAHQMKQAVLAGLLHRNQTGAGIHLSVSLQDAGLSALANQGTAWLGSGIEAQRIGSAHPQIAPYGTPYLTQDNAYLILAVGTDAQFARLCSILGLENVPKDTRFTRNAARVAHREALDAILSPALAAWKRDELLPLLHAADIPAGAVRTLGEALVEDTRVALRGPHGEPGLRQAVFAPALPLSPPPSLPPA